MPEDSRVSRVRRASFPVSDCLETWRIPSEEPCLDNTTSQPWSHATCPCSSFSSPLSCLFQQKEPDKAEVSTWKCCTGTCCIRPWLNDSWYYLDQVFQVPKGMRQVSRSNWRSGGINGALLTPSYLLALLRELLQVSQGLTENVKVK